MQWFQTMAVDARFRDRLVLGLDAKDGVVRTHGWTQASEGAGGGAKAVDIARDVDHLPLAAIIYTDIVQVDADGWRGRMCRRRARLAKVCKNVSIVAFGGVTTLADVMAALLLPIEGIIVGRALYEGTLKVADAVRELAA